MATAELTVGEPGTVDLAALVDYEVSSADPIPDGMTFSDGTLTGTPTTEGVTEVVCMFTDPFGNDTEVGRVTVTVAAASEPDPDPEPELPELVVGRAVTAYPVWELAGSPTGSGTWPPSIDPDTVPPGLTRDEPDRLTLSGIPTTAGTYTVAIYGPVDAHGSEGTLSTLELVIHPEDSEPDPEDPEDPEDPDEPELPELDPFDLYEILARSLAPRVAAFVGKPGDEDTIATAEAQVPVVTEYVRGYTRGRGFADEAPAGPLRAVIVSGVARLATNPEQVAHFQTGDYSERPAQLAGWTLTELGVLRRYRRTTA